ncbi:MAG: hypothetical protein O3A15_00160 [Proteobacteria bacterium]|nr:hypothetical protein [Pseudomonadota bacterium]
MNNIDIKEALTSLGYNLLDRGDYWQSTAVYRNGDNPTALQIYKDTGVWRDYVAGESFMPFKALIEKSLGTTKPADLDKYLSGVSSLPGSSIKKDLEAIPKIEKTFSLEDVDNLLPHYAFYNKKGISNETLKLFKAGMSTGGSMYQRFVFPIYNKNSRVHGLAGRDMSNIKDRPKWKHMGKKVYWIYPLHIKDESGERATMSSIMDSGEVILVESIGDMLSLFENGIKNVLVTFGLDISSELLINLIGLNLKKITLSFNNDFNNQENRGRNACVKNYLKLLSHFNQESVSICLPTKNDFGEMTESEISDWQIKKENNYRNHEKLCQVVLESAKDLYINKKLSNNIHKNVKKLPCYE